MMDRPLSEVMILYEDGVFGGKRQIIKHSWDTFAEKLLWKPARGWGGNSEPKSLLNSPNKLVPGFYESRNEDYSEQ